LLQAAYSSEQQHAVKTTHQTQRQAQVQPLKAVQRKHLTQ
jgi:hypothetical protein